MIFPLYFWCRLHQMDPGDRSRGYGRAYQRSAGSTTETICFVDRSGFFVRRNMIINQRGCCSGAFAWQAHWNSGCMPRTAARGGCVRNRRGWLQSRKAACGRSRPSPGSRPPL